MRSIEGASEMALERFGVPPELQPFIDSGFLQVLGEDDATMTVEFHMPSLRWKDGEGRITSYSLTWIHPDFNAQFCHYYEEVPGDLPNFWITVDTTDSGDNIVPDLETLDDLVDWLEDMQRSVR